jgi:hypothetical protein
VKRFLTTGKKLNFFLVCFSYPDSTGVGVTGKKVFWYTLAEHCAAPRIRIQLKRAEEPL